ncbi:3-succinoylsemialdehyde-pyridine dehydrogenase [Methyloligella halotolerans]|uniref:aldehyde dehydrogenase (NAD(+)) n=1 Tax=Methyloligella halotolerans TaxID=1177755 RepID=A0A1E2RWV4_9HYPH|nr:aldehyde dehydrogenase family protein [Methyloligella halotolerans]ODA66746.1 3-succinoylsemialdehyde-pyridine dehydrogenase [Methyloligella halotolerans]
MTDLKTDKFYIDGAWVAPNGGTTEDVINPANEEVIATIAMGTAEDVDAAVAAANRAFATFSETSREERIALLKKILEVYERRYAEMSSIICEELGAPIDLCDKAQTAVGVGHLKATIAALENFEFEHINAEGDLIRREPIGVCGMITPWNWPINQIALKVFPAMAVGCTVVLKPSEVTPLNALLFAEILDEAGVPAGVFNLVNGDGPTVGSALSKHPDIQMMSFTGSTRAGRLITKDAAETVKRVTLELGGKSPNVILDDADLEKSIKQGLAQCFMNSGQSCNAPTRMLVHESQYAEAMSSAAKLAETFEVGQPAEKGPHIGPLVSAVQFEKVQGLIETAIDEGAKTLAGGPGRPAGFNRGYFVRPTVFGEVTNDMTIAQEEVFGPVLVMISYGDDEEAIRIANDTPYGLCAFVQSGDLERAKNVMKRLRAGMVRINGTDIGFGSPFGGYKMSGNGREGGVFGLEDYCEIKAVSMP